jgi:uncharacterized protein HemX
VTVTAGSGGGPTTPPPPPTSGATSGGGGGGSLSWLLLAALALALAVQAMTASRSLASTARPGRASTSAT